MNPIRILIADDDAGMRLVMRRLVQRAEGYELAGEAADGDELLALYERENPDVVLMDVEMPGKTGVECSRAVHGQRVRGLRLRLSGEALPHGAGTEDAGAHPRAADGSVRTGGDAAPGGGFLRGHRSADDQAPRVAEVSGLTVNTAD